jgi:hypothetical protein
MKAYMHHGLPVLSAVFLTLWAACAQALADGSTYVAVIAYHVTNVGKEPIENALVSCRIPVSNRYQQIVDLAIEPAPEASSKDSAGQTLAMVDLGTLAPSQTKGVRIICWIKSKTAVITPAGEKGQEGKETLSDEQRTAYLEDAPPFGVEQLRKIAQEISARAASPMGRAKAIFEYMTTKFEYDMRDHLDAAPAVIERKEGSCSELAFAFVALCRAAGVPARIVTSFRNREGATPSVDWVGHRWAEFYADDIGWVPADPTNQINGFGKKSYWARQDPEFIALVDDGSKEVVSPRWEAMVPFYKPAQSKVETKRYATWRLSHDQQKERAFFDEGCQMLHKDKAEDRVAALEAWQQRREPLRGAFALEAAFDAEPVVRRQAARALAAADDPTLTLPMLRIHEEETNEGVKSVLLQSIKSLLASKNDKYREIALANLIKSRLESAIPLAAALVNDRSADVRWQLAAVLHRLGDKPEVNKTYAILLDDPEEIVRFQAAKQWARLGSWTAADKLVTRYLTSADPRRRMSALETLRHRAGDDFEFEPLGSPNSPRNQAARERWEQWVRDRGRQ